MPLLLAEPFFQALDHGVPFYHFRIFCKLGVPGGVDIPEPCLEPVDLVLLCP